jgi:arginase
VNQKWSWKEIALIGAPVGAGAGAAGCVMGPAALRTVNLRETLAALGHRVVDRGDVGVGPAIPDPDDQPANCRARRLPEIAAFARAVSAETLEALEKISFRSSSAETTACPCSVNGVARRYAAIARELFVLWLDAHADFNTPETSPSGNVHGMSLAMLAGESGLDDVLSGHPRALVKPSNIYLFGVRLLDREERNLLGGERHPHRRYAPHR